MKGVVWPRDTPEGWEPVSRLTEAQRAELTALLTIAECDGVPVGEPCPECTEAQVTAVADWLASANEALQERVANLEVEQHLGIRYMEDYKALSARIEEIARDLWRGNCDCGHRTDLHTKEAGCVGGLTLCSCSHNWPSIVGDRLREAIRRDA